MNNVYKDNNTINDYVRLLRMKLADEQRNHFAATGSPGCDPKQISPTQELLDGMKVLVPDKYGLSKQEALKAPDSDEDKIDHIDTFNV